MTITGFFSYASIDWDAESAFIRDLVDKLQLQARANHGNRRFSLEWDRKGVRWADDWAKKLPELIDSTDLFFLLLSPSWIQSDICRQELALFLKREEAQGWSDRVFVIRFREIPLVDPTITNEMRTILDQLETRHFKSWQSLPDADSAARDVEYRVAGKEIAEKLRAIDAAYQAPDTATRPRSLIRDAVSAAPPAPIAFLDVQVTAQLLALQQRVAQGVAKDLDAALDRLREGDRSLVERDLLALRADAVQWSSLEPAVHARVLRLLGSCRLQNDDPDGAERLADEADALCPAEEARLRALIVHERQGAEAALAWLETPVTQDGANLRLALLIEAMRFEAARALLDGSPLLAEPDADTWRLRAFLALEEDRREDALAAIREAEALAPGWLAVRQAGGIIRYAYAASSAVPPAVLRSPNPLHPDLFRQDVTSRLALDEAVACFDAVLSRPLPDTSRRMMETWRLAALAVNHKRRDAAAAAATELLRGDRTHWGALSWSLAVGFTFDQKRARRALDDLLDAGRGEAPHLVVALALQLERGRAGKARKLLDRHAHRFNDENDIALIDHWRASVEANAKETADPPARLARALHNATVTGDWQPVADLLPILANDRDAVRLVLPACQAAATAGRWDVVAPFVSVLADRIATAEALRLSAYASHITDAPDRALALIDQYREAGGEPCLPEDMRRLQVAALQASGQVAQALRLNQSLSLDTMAPADRLRQAELYGRIGDIESAARTLSDPGLIEHLDAAEAVRWGQLIGHRDHTVAKMLLSHAEKKGIADQLLPTAACQALHLAAPELQRRMMARMNKLASSGDRGAPVKAISIEDLPDIISRQRKSDDHLKELYLHGQVPVHILAGWMHENLPAFYSFDSQDLRPTPLNRPPFLIRFGGRPLGDHPVDLRNGVVIDATALLLADAVDLLSLVETAGIRIQVVPSVPHALAELEASAGECQPNRVAAWDAIIRAVEDSRVQVAFVEAAGESPSGTCRVVHSLDTDGGTATEQTQITPRSLIEVLKDHGRLDASQYEKAVAHLGETKGHRSALHLGATLAFDFNTIETIADLGLLDAVTIAFAVEIDPDYLNYVRGERRQLEERKRLADRLRRLREQVAQRLAGDHWSTARIGPELPKVREYSPATAVEQCLWETFRVSPKDPVPLWVDDRFLSQYPRSHNHPIIGITDVLQSLNSTGHLPDSLYFERLLLLRRARAHFIPVTPNEVLYHLQAAPIVKGVVIETPALETLRTNFADAMLLEEYWSLPDGDESLQELPLAQQFTGLVDKCLGEVWSVADIPSEDRYAWSDWIWGCLRADRFTRIPQAGEADAARLLSVQCLAFPATRAISLLEPQDEANQHLCRNFLSWWERRILDPAVAREPGMAAEIADLIAGILLEPVPADDVETKQALAYLRQRLINVLPEKIRTLLFRRKDVARSLPSPPVSVVGLGGYFFEWEAFWDAICLTRQGQDSTVIATDGQAHLHLRAGTDPSDLFVRLGDSESRLAADPGMVLADADPSAWRKAFQSHPEWVDAPPSERLATVKAILSAPSPAKRMSLLGDAREHSVPYRLTDWRRRDLNDGGPFSPFPPPVADLLRYLRFDGSATDPAAALDTAVMAVLDEFGPFEAVKRFGGLPLPPSTAVRNAFARLPENERNRSLDDLARETLAPIGSFWVLSLMRESGHPSFGDQMDQLLDRWPAVGEALVAALRWSEGAFAQTHDWRALPASTRLLLVWTHSHHVVQTLLAANVPGEKIAEYCIKHRPKMPAALRLVYDDAYHRSACHPDVSIAPSVLLFHGLASVIGGDGADSLTEDQRRRIEDLLCLSDGFRRGLDPRLLLVRTRIDPFRSFFGLRPQGIFATRPDPDETAADAAIARAVQAVLDRPTDPEAWAFTAAIGIRLIEAQALKEAIKSLDIPTLVLANEENKSFILQSACNLSAPEGDLATWLLDRIGSSATECANYFSGPVAPLQYGASATPGLEVALTLFEALAKLSKRPTCTDAVAFLSKGLTMLGQSWPAASPLWRHIAKTLYDELPFSVSAPLWETWVHLRSRS